MRDVRTLEGLSGDNRRESTGRTSASSLCFAGVLPLSLPTLPLSGQPLICTSIAEAVPGPVGRPLQPNRN